MSTYTISKRCDCCGLCLTAAPENIHLQQHTLLAEFFRQPITDKQIRDVEMAMKICSKKAIIKK